MQTGARTFARLGVLRAVLLTICLALVLLRPDPGTAAIYAGIGMARTLIVPVLTPIFFMVLLFDVMMSSIQMVDKQGDEHLRFKAILMIEAGVVFLMLLVWLPYFGTFTA